MILYEAALRSTILFSSITIRIKAFSMNDLRPAHLASLLVAELSGKYYQKRLIKSMQNGMVWKGRRKPPAF